jgi:type IV secretory pathway TrbD component
MRLLEAANEKRDSWRRQTANATLGGGEREMRLLGGLEGVNATNRLWLAAWTVALRVVDAKKI